MADRITFPHMGNLWIPAQTFFEELGQEVIVPPRNSRHTLELGVKYAPEFACLPLKINLGNFIEAIENGANYIVMGGGVGPCRFGYYGEVQREILQNLGYDFRMICLEPDIISTYRGLQKLLGNPGWKKLYNAGKLAWQQILAMDEVEKNILIFRGKTENISEVDDLYNTFLQELSTTRTVTGIHNLKEEYLNKMNNYEREFPGRTKIRIGLVGEIYVVIESFVNLDLAHKLGELGVEVDRKLYISSWIKHFIAPAAHKRRIQKLAYPYLQTTVGGHGRETVADTVIYAEKGFEGVIQLAPFTCMPEIVARTVLPVVSKKERIPFLSLVFDEHTGEAGLVTRLEAFIDLLRRDKEKRVMDNG